MTPARCATAVQRFADVVPQTDVDPQLLISIAQVLETDGIVATSGGRFESSLVAKWEFREGSPATPRPIPAVCHRKSR